MNVIGHFNYVRSYFFTVRSSARPFGHAEMRPTIRNAKLIISGNILSTVSSISLGITADGLTARNEVFYCAQSP
jgi:hypothetical protein